MLLSHFIFQPSRQITLLIAAGGLMASAAVLIIPMPPPLPFIAAIAVAAIFFHTARRFFTLTGKTIAGGLIINKNQGDVIVLDADGQQKASGNIVYTFVSAWLSSAIIKSGRQHYVILLMPDSLPADEYRQLRIWLNRLGIPSDDKTAPTLISKY